jgi:hypothetical protein
MGLSASARGVFEAAFYRRLGLQRTEADALFDSLAHPLPAGTELLVIHDTGDRALDASNALSLHDAHGASSRLLLTRGQGHNRILASDEALDAVLAFASGGVRAVDAASIGVAQPTRASSEMRP